MRQHQPDNGQKPQSLLQRAGVMISQRSILVRNEGTNSAHIRGEFLNEFQILCQCFRRLPWGTHHKSAAHLISDFLQLHQALHTVVERHFCRMEFFVMSFISCLMAQKIPVGPCIVQFLVTFPGTFSYRERQRTVLVSLLDLSDQTAQNLIVPVCVLAALQNKGAKAKLVASCTAFQNLVCSESVAVTVMIGTANPAVETVVSAQIRKFDQSSDIDGSTVYFPADAPGFFADILHSLRGTALNQNRILLKREAMLILKLIDQGNDIPIHDSPHLSRRF